MHADTAVSEEIRKRLFPDARLEGSANLLIMPSLDAANISHNVLKVLGDAQNVGPMLIGMAQPVHVVTPSITARGLVNMTALAMVAALVDRKSVGSGKSVSVSVDLVGRRNINKKKP